MVRASRHIVTSAWDNARGTSRGTRGQRVTLLLPTNGQSVSRETRRNNLARNPRAKEIERDSVSAGTHENISSLS